MRAKFSVGDKVVVNGRCPKYILEHIRHNRTRTVTGVYYDDEKQCTFYTLGTNRHANSNDYGWAHTFRSYELHAPIKRGVGRPCTKRQYRRNLGVECTATPPDENLAGDSTKQVVDYSKTAKTPLAISSQSPESKTERLALSTLTI
jgi:hypothetical protein